MAMATRPAPAITPSANGPAKLTPSRRRALALAFAAYDIDENDVLDRTEIMCLLKEMGITPSEEEVKEILRCMDRNHDGKIDFNEFQEASDASLARMGLTQARIQETSFRMQQQYSFSKNINSTRNSPLSVASVKSGSAWGASPPLSIFPMDAVRPAVPSYLLRRLIVHLCPRLCALSEAFLRADLPLDGSVSRELFLQSLTAQEVPLTEEELQNLAGHYTEAFSEKVLYRSFLEALFKMHNKLVTTPPSCNTPTKIRSPMKAPPQPPSASPFLVRAEPQPPPPLALPPPLPASLTLPDEPPWLQQVLTTLRMNAAEAHRNLRQAFMALDTERSGHLTPQAFLAVFQTYRVPLSFAQMQALVHLYDPGGEEAVPYQAVIRRAEHKPTPAEAAEARAQSPLYKQPPRRLSPDPQTARRAGLKVLQNFLHLKNGSLKEMFLRIDTHRTGHVTAQDFRAVLDGLPILVDDDLVQQLVRTFDRQG
eukprot:EG_transcript_10791